MNYFGTDGIRLKDTNKLKFIAKKLSYALQKFNAKTVVIGKDTRKNGTAIEKVFLKHLKKNGILVTRLKVVPTAAVAYYTTLLKADYGIMLTASHNPADVNGIKIFNSVGEKLLPKQEEEFEFYIDFPYENIKQTLQNKYGIQKAKVKKGKVVTIKPTEYLNLLKENAPEVNNKKIVIDCSNGASKFIGPKLFSLIKADVKVIFNKSGKHINENCGAVHPEALAQTVLKNKADIGFAFDGDADRCVCVLKNGEILSGDNLLFALAKHLKVKKVVGTIYSNGALDKALKTKGIELHRSDVGDQEVKRKMNEIGAIFGGERSGHFIFSNILPTGDGLLTALKILEIKNLEKECSFKKIASKVINIQSLNKEQDIKKLMEIKQSIESKPDWNGRIILRPSGTEDLIRILVEHKRLSIAEEVANTLKDAHEKE